MWYLLGEKNNIGIYYYLITSGIPRWLVVVFVP